MLEIVQKPWVEHRNEVTALEIAIDTPMKGMFQESDKLWKELSKYVSSQKIVEDQGLVFYYQYVYEAKAQSPHMVDRR